ncbi:protocatechuate 3,4-dioxygenase [uncultured Cocleimonas sp.]|uniref:protocatechuate 3,4-dioxygenase n=1 Tax=uncultured Cocleimonas sp. TaxID=1051587 RepID=UPI00261E09F7|nr:protocatechuate 3,4-dioxygenase [uncultured Cocleimonas sp.]
MKHTANNRRKFIQSLLALPCLSILPVSAAMRTPRATEGPFYPTKSMRYGDIDNDLVKISNEVKQAGGEVLHLQGRVLDTNNKPIKGARVEIWQCDANGHYLHTGDRNPVPLDKAFQGFGHTISGHNGEYSFRTIKPVSYPGRTPHIHVKAFANGRELTTQFYIDDYPENDYDFLFNRMSLEQQEAVSMRLKQGKEGLEATLDIIV